MRKFVQPVAMRCSQEVQVKLKMALSNMGYSVAWLWPHESETHPIVVCGYGKDWRCAGNCVDGFNHGAIVVASEGAFLAVAAISQGSEIFNGEWLIVNDRGEDSLVVVHNVEAGRNYISVKRADEIKESGYFTLPKAVLRKATLEEILTHFEAKPSVTQEKEEPIRVIRVGGWPPRVAFERLNQGTLHYFQVTEKEVVDYWGGKLYKKILADLSIRELFPYEEEDEKETHSFSIEQAKGIVAKSIGVSAQEVIIDGR